MGRAIAVKTDYSGAEVRRLAKRTKDAAQARRLLAVAAILDGASREEAAKTGGMDRQTLRDWVIRFNEQGPDGLINIASPGATDVRRQRQCPFPFSAQLPTFEMIKKAAIWAALSPWVGCIALTVSTPYFYVVTVNPRPPRSSEFSCSPGWFGVKVDAAHDDARRISFELPG